MAAAPRPSAFPLWWLLGIVAAVLAVAVAVRAFVFPRSDVIRAADAVVVLAGGDGERLEAGLALVERGAAPVLVIANGTSRRWPRANAECAGARPYRVVCFRPQPQSTRGEARVVARLAADAGWDSIAVVTSTYHVTRARLWFDRCVDARVRVASAGYRADAIGVMRHALYESAGVLQALLWQRGC